MALLNLVYREQLFPRRARRIERHLAGAKLPAGMTFDTFDFNLVPMVSKAQVMTLAAGARLARSRCQYHAL